MQNAPNAPVNSKQNKTQINLFSFEITVPFLPNGKDKGCDPARRLKKRLFFFRAFQRIANETCHMSHECITM
jgi:hypothetical protein